jgi:ribosomal protein L12E/L44/L45/RPP1/RPP2
MAEANKRKGAAINNNHRRRERPRKLRVSIITNNDDDSNNNVDRTNLPTNQNLYEPDVNSFLSNCIGGAPTKNSTRSLPSLSNLAMTTIAVEKRRLKIEKERNDDLVAELEAKKVLALHPLMHSTSSIIVSPPTAAAAGGGGVDVSNNNGKKKKKKEQSQKQQKQQSTMENTSKVTMPPLLEQFIKNFNDKYDKKKDG